MLEKFLEIYVIVKRCVNVNEKVYHLAAKKFTSFDYEKLYHVIAKKFTTSGMLCSP